MGLRALLYTGAENSHLPTEVLPTMASEQHVLVVDDEEKIVFFLRESLQGLGQQFRVATAGSAEEALAKIDDQPYDLVISDLCMPGLDGLQLLETIRERSPRTRFILMTAYGSDEVEKRAQSLEAYKYITKPFHVSDLLSVARQALAEPAAKGDFSPSLTDNQIDAIERTLSNLRFEVGAQCAFLADRGGRIVSEVGLTQGMEMGTFLPLVAKSLASTSGLAEYLNDEETFNLQFYEGRKYDIHSTAVDEDHFLTLVFDRRKQPSRIGMVWLYAKRATADLLRILTVSQTERAPVAYPEARQATPEAPPPLSTAAVDSGGGDTPETRDRLAPEQKKESTFGIEEALRKGLIDKEFAQLLQGED
jgi:CheY-like chemotaxis protein